MLMSSDWPEARDAAHMLQMRVDQGWEAAILTFMFNQMPGNREAIRRSQESEVEKAYARFVLRVVRRPLSPAAWAYLPIWIGAPDLPVWKREKQSLRDVSVNDGQHVQLATVTPPKRRFPGDFRTFVMENQQLFVGDGPCCRVHAEPITHDMTRVMEYIVKSIDRRLFGEDTLIVLPRSSSEVRPSKRKFGNASICADGTCVGSTPFGPLR